MRSLLLRSAAALALVAPPAAAETQTAAGTLPLLARRDLPTSAYAQLAAAPAADEIVLDTITVQGEGARPTSTLGPPPPPYAGGQVGSGTRVGLLGNRSVFDTPFNITGYTEKLIRDRGARTLTDVVDNDPSVRAIVPRGSNFEQFYIRGFRLSSTEINFDGLYGIVNPYRIALEPVERVEVLKGPSALLNGLPPGGNIGGSINLIPKRAPDEPLTRLTTDFVSRGQVGVHLDLARRFGPSNEWGVRFNGARRGGRTELDGNTIDYGVAALGLDYRGERVRLSADLGIQEQNVNAPTRQFIAQPGFQIPKAPNGRLNVKQPWEFFDANHRYGTVRGEVDLSENVTAFAAYGRSRAEEYFFGTAGVPTILNARGDLSLTVQNAPGEIRSQTAEAGVRANFSTGFVRHQVAVAASGLWQDQDYSAPVVGLPYASNLYAPVRVPPRSRFGLRRDGGPSTEREFRGVAIADTLSVLDDRILLTVGGRFQDVVTEGFDNATGARTSRVSGNAFSPAVGLVVKPTERLSLYGNYIEGLSPGQIAPATASNAGTVFPPFVSKQMEIGAKYDFGTVGVSAALFQITQPSSFLDGSNRFTVDGEQRNRGLELNVFGEPLPGVRLLGGLALIDGVQTSTANGLNDGRKSVGVPELQMNLYGEWDLPGAQLSGVTLTGRVIHTTGQFYDAANTQSIPAWTRIDLGARKTFDVQGRPVTVRAVVENVFDADYWASAAGGILAQGAPRTVVVSATIDF